MTAGTHMVDDILKSNPEHKSENRIFYLTDMCPNIHNVQGRTLSQSFQDNAKRKIYTTFIGVGIDFNTNLVRTLSID